MDSRSAHSGIAGIVSNTKKITVQELKDMLTSLQQANKSDADVATQLKQTELTEQLSLRAAGQHD